MYSNGDINMSIFKRETTEVEKIDEVEGEIRKFVRRDVGRRQQRNDGEMVADNISSLLQRVSLPRTQIRAYRWCSPPRMGCAIISPNRSIGRAQGASFRSARWVRTSL
jgi:hypothetical protein